MRVIDIFRIIRPGTFDRSRNFSIDSVSFSNRTTFDYLARFSTFSFLAGRKYNFLMVDMGEEET